MDLDEERKREALAVFLDHFIQRELGGTADIQSILNLNGGVLIDAVGITDVDNKGIHLSYTSPHRP